MNNSQKNTVFKTPMFDSENIEENNSKSWELFERISKTGDDRSKSILAGIIVEHYLDRILKLLFIDYKFLTDRSDFTYSFKISLLKSLRLIPHNIIIMCDCVRKVRNEFAHNLELENIQEIDLKIQKQVHQLYSEDSEKNKDIELIEKFKAVYTLGYSNLRAFEQNIRLLREKIDDPKFEEELSVLNSNRIFETYDKIIEKGPIKIIDRGDEIEEVYPKALGVLKKKLKKTTANK
jgi:hypothetical protein